MPAPCRVQLDFATRRERLRRCESSFSPRNELRVTFSSAIAASRRPNDAFKAVARAASPSTRSAHLSSSPLRFFFNVNLSPCGDIVRT